MTDHGLLDDDEADRALGAMVTRCVDQLQFCTPGATAKTAFELNGKRFEIRVQAVAE